MPFDALGVCRDNSTDLTADEAPTSVIRSGGQAVIDLKETGVRGLAAVVVFPSAITTTGAPSGATIDIDIEESAVEGSGYVRLVSFKQVNALASPAEVPAVFIRRFATNKGYVRAKMDITLTGGTSPTINAGKVEVLLSPYPFEVL